MGAWVLIIVLHGWGAGVGSTGNAVSMMEFTSKEKCEAAISAIMQNHTKTLSYSSAQAMQATCVEK